jgi:hypothetical protein
MIIGNFKVMSAMESLQHHGNMLEVVHSGQHSMVGTIPKIVRIQLIIATPSLVRI